mgnify:CR=1 FL=1
MGEGESTMETLAVKSNFWQGKTVLVTGHTGFKGAWLTLWLIKLGAKVIGVSSNIPTKPSLFSILNLKNKIIHKKNINYLVFLNYHTL